MRRKQKKPKYRASGRKFGYYRTHPQARKYRKYRDPPKRDWDNYLNYKKYYYFVKAAQSTGDRRIGYLMRAQKEIVDRPPPQYYAVAPHLSADRQLARLPNKYERWQLYDPHEVGSGMYPL